MVEGDGLFGICSGEDFAQVDECFAIVGPKGQSPAITGFGFLPLPQVLTNQPQVIMVKSLLGGQRPCLPQILRRLLVLPPLVCKDSQIVQGGGVGLIGVENLPVQILRQGEVTRLVVLQGLGQCLRGSSLF